MIYLIVFSYYLICSFISSVSYKLVFRYRRFHIFRIFTFLVVRLFLGKSCLLSIASYNVSAWSIHYKVSLQLYFFKDFFLVLGSQQIKRKVQRFPMYFKPPTRIAITHLVKNVASPSSISPQSGTLVITDEPTLITS